MEILANGRKDFAFGPVISQFREALRSPDTQFRGVEHGAASKDLLTGLRARLKRTRPVDPGFRALEETVRRLDGVPSADVVLIESAALVGCIYANLKTASLLGLALRAKS
jgi:hypothetical protein